LPARP